MKNIKTQKPNQKIFLLSIAFIVALAAVSYFMLSQEEQSEISPVVSTDVAVLGESLQTSQFLTGTTFTQYSLDSWGDAAAIASGKSLLLNSTNIVNQHIMGFGASNPEESPDVYNFSTIERRIGLSTGVAKDAETIVLTACCAPDWMKGGSAGSTNWADFEKAPFPEFFDDYAELVAEIVSQPDFANVKYLQVWNEMKGFYSSSLGRWNYESYTDLYNQVWTAVKAVRPDIKIGGPYVVVTSNGGGKYNDSIHGGVWGKFDQRDLDTITYWLQNKLGADFIAVDGKNQNKDSVELVDQFERTEKFEDFMTWLRALSNTTYPGATTLPVWWSEWYARTDDDSTSSQALKNAVMTTGLIRTIKSGAQTALIWGPQGDAAGNREPLALFNDTQISGGGVATPFHASQKYLNDHFANGTQILVDTVSNGNIESIVSSTKTLLVNTKGSTQTGTFRGQALILGAYEVALINTPTNSPEQNSGNQDSGQETSSEGSNSINQETQNSSNPASSATNEEMTENEELANNLGTDGLSLRPDEVEDGAIRVTSKQIAAKNNQVVKYIAPIALAFGTAGSMIAAYVWRQSLLQYLRKIIKH